MCAGSSCKGYRIKAKKKTVFLLLIAIVGVAVWVTLEIKRLEIRDVYFQLVGPCNQSLYFRKQIAQKLKAMLHTTQQLQSLSSFDIKDLLSQLAEVSEVVDPRITSRKLDNETQEQLEHLGQNMSNFLTVILDISNYENMSEVFSLINSIKLPAVAGMSYLQSEKMPGELVPKNVKLIVISDKEDQVWTVLAKYVETPFTLVGRSLTTMANMNMQSFQTQIDILRTSSKIGVVGSGTINDLGIWTFKCNEINIRNYFLYFVNGYSKVSKNCVFCGSIDSPFVTRTHLLLDASLGENYASFSDWFLTLQHNGLLVLSCPDVTLSIRNTNESNSLSKRDYLPFVKKWELESVFIPPKTMYLFTHNDINIDCDPFRVSRKKLMPPFCVDKVNHAITVLHEFTRAFNISYELDSGLSLGAVKFNGFMPWDIDGDISFQTESFQFYKIHQNFFTHSKVDIGKFEEPSSKSAGFFCLYSPEVFIEMWGEHNISIVLLSNITIVETKVKFGNKWVNGNINPGLYARSRYGFNNLKHSQSWRVWNGDSSFNSYIPGRWLSCSVPNHHGCLDNYPADGNLDFQYPKII